MPKRKHQQKKQKDAASGEIIKKIIFPRIGFLGNPSDGFFGKTISFPFRNFQAEVMLWPSEILKFIFNADDQDEFASLDELYSVTQGRGYYGGIRLIKAAISVFIRYCRNKGIRLADDNFTLAYRSSIPQQRGLAGSSAIITGTILALVDFYRVNIKLFPPEILANLTLQAETKELGIAAGLQDRVVQAYNQPVYMDFSRQAFARHDGFFGEYKIFPATILPPMGLVWSENMSESGKVHSDVRSRFEKADLEVVLAMTKFAQIAEDGMRALKNHDLPGVMELVNANFDLRRKIYSDKVIGKENIEMVKAARRLGAAAKFPGSGGAVLLVAKEDKIDKIILGLQKLGYKSERIIL